MPSPGLSIAGIAKSLALRCKASDGDREAGRPEIQRWAPTRVAKQDFVWGSAHHALHISKAKRFLATPAPQAQRDFLGSGAGDVVLLQPSGNTALCMKMSVARTQHQRCAMRNFEAHSRSLSSCQVVLNSLRSQHRHREPAGGRSRKAD